jgi:hypothetical protein
MGAVCLLASAAHAKPDRIVIEAYEGERPTDAATTLAPIYDELQSRGYVGGAALAGAINEQLSHDARTLTASQMVDAQKQVDEAFQRFIDGDYPRALAAAQAALAIYDTAPGQLARESALRDLRYKALVVAARSAEVKGDTQGAFALMAEVVRSFPDRPVSSAEFDPKVAALYHNVKADLDHQGSGSLEIKVDDPAATVFVDEQFEGPGASLGKLPPGRYRIYVAKGRMPGRVHQVDVAPGSSSSITISWALDGALRTSGADVVLELDKAASPEEEVDAATQVARALGARSVAVLAVRPLNGHRAIAGYSVDVESQSRAFAAVQMEPIAAPAETMRRLGALLAGDKSVGETGLILTEPGHTVDGAAQATHEAGHRSHVAPIALGVLAVAGIVGAVVSESSAESKFDSAKTEPDPTRRADLTDQANLRRGVAIGAGAVALVSIGVDVYLWLRSDSPPAHDEHAVRVVPTSSSDSFGIAVTGGF